MRRHPHVERLCLLLERIVHGRAASELIDTGASGDQLFLLPVWSWQEARISVGHKDCDDADPGQRLLLPVRMRWHPGPLVLTSADLEGAAGYVGTGLGHGMAGVLDLDAGAPDSTDTGPVLEDGKAVPSQAARPAIQGRSRVRAELSRLARDGHSAYWEALTLMEAEAARALRRAQYAQSYDLMPQHQRGRVLDDIAMETIRTHMVYGAPDSDHSCVQRLVDRCTQTRTFLRVDPGRYVTDSLRRDARAAVRRALGDPHVGSKVRALALELGREATLAELVAAYRDRYPADKLSLARAAAALSTAPHLSATALPFTDDRLPAQNRKAA